MWTPIVPTLSPFRINHHVMKKIIISIVVVCMTSITYAQIPVIDVAHIGVNTAGWVKDLDQMVKQYEKLKKQNATLNEYLNLYYKVNGYVKNGKKLQNIKNIEQAINQRIKEAKKLKAVDASSYNDFLSNIATLSSKAQIYLDHVEAVKTGPGGLSVLGGGLDVSMGLGGADILSQNGLNIDSFTDNLRENGAGGFENLLNSITGTIVGKYNFSSSKLRMNDGERMRELNEMEDKLRDVLTEIDTETEHYKRINNYILILQELLK